VQPRRIHIRWSLLGPEAFEPLAPRRGRVRSAGGSDFELTEDFDHDMGGAAVEVLESVLGCSTEEAFTIYSGREVTGPKPDPARKLPRQPGARGTLTDETRSWSGCQGSG
jgi:hypothetical protein